MTTRYRYRASTPEGKLIEGVLDATSKGTALGELRRQRLYAVDLAPMPGKGRLGGRASTGKTPALALFARTLATMLGAGVTVDRALSFSAQHVPNAAVADAIRQVQVAVQEGAGLAEGMARYPEVFPPLFVAMASAGEESGALDESLASLADHLDEMVELNAQVRSFLLYPALMGITSLAGTLVLLFFVIPRFAGMLAEVGGSLPLSTRLLVAVSQLVLGGWWLILGVVVALTFAARAWLSRPENRRRLHASRLTWPLVGELELKYATANFTRVLGMLLRNGRPVLVALRVARGAVANTELTARLDRATEMVRRGQQVHEALAGTLPALAAEMISVGEESGRLDDLCLRVATGYDAEVRRALRTGVALIEPVMIVVFGVVVGFVALAMLQAVYGINTGLL